METTKIHITVDSPYRERVEAHVKEALSAEVIWMQEVVHDRTERRGYWERAYIVAWVNNRQSGTHRVCINSNDESVAMWGHYFMNDTEGDNAIIDARERL